MLTKLSVTPDVSFPVRRSQTGLVGQRPRQISRNGLLEGLGQECDNVFFSVIEVPLLFWKLSMELFVSFPQNHQIQISAWMHFPHNYHRTHSFHFCFIFYTHASNKCWYKDGAPQ